ncbi:MAG TPA: nuclear transport factor 2 family protein [Candidatus Dormibacteraeota bacterium]
MSNLVALVSAWVTLLGKGDASELETLLDPEVVWQGLEPELVCKNRDEVMGLVKRFAARTPRLTRFDAQEIGDRVAVYVEGPDFPENDVMAAGAPRTLTFTFRGGAIVRMESVRTREAAFTA